MPINLRSFKKLEKKRDAEIEKEDKYGKEVIRKIYKLLIKKPHKAYALHELARMFNVSSTVLFIDMNFAFSDLYGTKPLYKGIGSRWLTIDEISDKYYYAEEVKL